MYSIMYFPTFDAVSGELTKLRMTPMRLRKLRLNRAAPEDAVWLGDRLGRIGREKVPAAGQLGAAVKQRRVAPWRPTRPAHARWHRW